MRVGKIVSHFGKNYKVERHKQILNGVYMASITVLYHLIIFDPMFIRVFVNGFDTLNVYEIFVHLDALYLVLVACDGHDGGL